jgi:hypothetical protein
MLITSTRSSATSRHISRRRCRRKSPTPISTTFASVFPYKTQKCATKVIVWLRDLP